MRLSGLPARRRRRTRSPGKRSATREQAMPQPRTAVPRRQVQQRRPRSSNIAISQLWP